MIKKSFLIVFIFLGLVLFSVFVYQKNFQPTENFEMLIASNAYKSYKHAKVTIGGKIFDAYVSDTEKLRENGLSGFAGLKNNEVMLFVFPDADIYGFWMKDMLFPIDILWIDDNFTVISTKKNIAPDTFPKIFFPKKPGKYVVEFTAGVLDTLGVINGDKVSIVGGK